MAPASRKRHPLASNEGTPKKRGVQPGTAGADADATDSPGSTPAKPKARPKKTKPGKKATEQTLSLEAQAKLDLKVANDKNHALAHRIGDIRLANRDVFGNQPVLAAYLRMKNTNELHQFVIDSASAKGIMKDWEAQRSVNFNMPVKDGAKDRGKVPEVPKKSIFDYITNPNSIDESVLTTNLPLDEKDYPRDKASRGAVSWVVAMYQVIQQNPASFTTEGDENDTSLLANITIENWNRAYETLRYFHRVYSDVGNSGSNRKQNNLAQAPILLSREDILGRAKENKEAVANLDNNLALLASDNESDSEKEEPTEEKAVAALNEVHETFQKKPLGGWRLPKPGQVRSAIPLVTQIGLCQTLAKQVAQIWPPSDVDLCPADDAPPPEVDQPVHLQAAKAAAEEVLGNEPEEQRVKDFWDLQREMNAVSCDAPSYAEACDYVGMDPLRPAIRDGRAYKDTSSDGGQAANDSKRGTDLILFPWQVIAVAWALQLERSKRPAGTLADDMGVGKTIATIVTLLLSDPETICDLSPAVENQPTSTAVENQPTSTAVETQPQSTAVDIGQVLNPSSTPMATAVAAKLPNRKYKPNLILFPSNAAPVWKEEYAKNFPYFKDLWYWFGNPNSGKQMDRDRTIPASVRGLVEFLGRLPDQASTARVVILCSLQTLRKRSLYVATDKEAASVVRRTMDEELDDEDLDEVEMVNESKGVGVVDGEEEAESTEAELSRWKSYLTGFFRRVCVDEAHLLKSTLTRTNRAVYLLNPSFLLLISGSPMINKAADYGGLLKLLYRPHLNPQNKDPVPEDYESFNAAFDGKKLTAVDIEQHHYLLEPDAFRRLMRGGHGEQVEPQRAHTILRPILRMVQLRRTMAHEFEVNGETVQIGKKIPPYRIWTVEIDLLRHQSKAYFKVHNLAARQLGRGHDDETGDAQIDMLQHRRLVHAVLNPQLDSLASNKVAQVNKWYERYEDFGATMLFKASRPAPELKPYLERADMAFYMAGKSAKLAWLAGHANHVVNERSRKLLIFCNLPLTLLNVLAFLVNLSFKCLTIRSADSPEERKAARAAFNDGNNPSQILITSIAVSGASLNLQDACADCVFVDVPGSANAMLQALHRLFRLGQVLTGNIVILTLDHSYDQALQARATNKMIGQIAGQGAIYVTPKMRKEGAKEDEAGNPISTREVDNEIIRNQCLELYRKMCGQRSSRHEWIDAYDITAKDLYIAEEVEFREQNHLPKGTPRGFDPLPEDKQPLILKERTRIMERMMASVAEADSDDENLSPPTRPPPYQDRESESASPLSPTSAEDAAMTEAPATTPTPSPARSHASKESSPPSLSASAPATSPVPSGLEPSPGPSQDAPEYNAPTPTYGSTKTSGLSSPDLAQSPSPSNMAVSVDDSAGVEGLQVDPGPILTPPGQVRRLTNPLGSRDLITGQPTSLTTFKPLKRKPNPNSTDQDSEAESQRNDATLIETTAKDRATPRKRQRLPKLAAPSAEPLVPRRSNRGGRPAPRRSYKSKSKVDPTDDNGD